MTSIDGIRPASAKASLLALARALRVPQWVKNLLVFVPVLLDHKPFQTTAVLPAALAFAAFCAAASGAYVINDLFDLEADRRHHHKRARPFAAGVLSPAFGRVLGPSLLALGLAIGARVGPLFLGLLALYALVTTAYSVRLKQVPVLDVLLLAGLYTLRVLAGIAASQVRFSTWLLAFSMFLFLSLAFLKRHAELTGLGPAVAEPGNRRGYVWGDREWLGAMGGASGYLSVLVLALYVDSEQVVTLYRTPMILWGICPLLLFWISRMWLLAYRGRIHEDPIVATVRDPVSYLIGALVVLMVVAAA